MVRPSALENSPATPRMSCDHGVGVRTGRRDHFRLGLWRNRRWDSPAKIRFAPDSALEGTGFEPSVPRDTTNLSMSPLVGSPPTEKSERKRTDTRNVGLFPRGTDGSNPVPSLAPNDETIHVHIPRRSPHQDNLRNSSRRLSTS